MKKLLAFIAAVMLCIPCVALASCGETPIDEISIVAPASTEISAGETFTLEYKTVPEEAAEKIKVNWKISDMTKLSYKNGEFTALTCGTVKVTASVKGSEATDEIKLKVKAPKGFSEYSDTGYQLVYPSSWTPSTLGKVQMWSTASGYPNMNIVTETLNAAYFSSPASAYQTKIETTYSLMGYTVNFTKPVTVKKSKYLGVERVQVDFLYTLTAAGSTTSIHQTQMIFNNAKVNLSCVLTITYRAEDFNAAAEKLQETLFSQFMPA